MNDEVAVAENSAKFQQGNGENSAGREGSSGSTADKSAGGV